MKIVVLGGGISTERHVALVTATSVCKGLRSLGHKAIFVDMFLGLENYDGELEDAFDVPDGFCGNVAIEHTAPDLEAVKKSRIDQSPSHLGKNVLEICRLADCVFLGLHGKDGEDGKIQSALDLLGVKYTGSPALGSAIAMDKLMSKKILREEGLPTPPEADGAPCVVKLNDGGSSIGVYICETDDDYREALKAVEGQRFLVEKLIRGRELTVPVLGDKALNAIEIIPPDGSSFDYVSKYQSGPEGAQEICPADITPDQQKMLGDLALAFHRALGLEVYSRTDFILDEVGNPYILEVNTLPGMTPNSLIPRSARIEGLDYAHLCEKIVLLSMEKQ